MRIQEKFELRTRVELLVKGDYIIKAISTRA